MTPRRPAAVALAPRTMCWAVLGTAVLAGCSGGDEEDAAARDSDLRPRGVGPAVEGAPPPPSGAATPPMDPKTAPTARRRPDPPGRASTAADDDEDVNAGERPRGARDLPGELSREFGTPTGCFPPAYLRTQPGALVVSLSARVRRDGEIASHRLTAPGAPEEVVDCLSKHAAGLRMISPVPEAPRRVETRITFQLGTGPPEETAGSPSPGPAASDASD